MTLVPRIETDRLLLRELRIEDFDVYAEHVADAEAMTFTDGAVNRRVAYRIYGAMAGGWLLNRAGWWAIELRETQAMVGVVGAFFRETSLPVSPDSDLELGWSVFRAHWRKGIASEAARAALLHGLSAHPARRAIAHVASANAASVGVTRALGMQRLGPTDFYGEPVELFAVDRAAVV